MDQEWDQWQKDGKDQRRLRGLVSGLKPVIDGTMRSAGISNPVVLDHARLVAAKAIQSYDPTKGGKLGTHVATQLRSVVRDAPKMQEPLIPGERFRREAAELHRTGIKFIDSFGRDPSDEELSEMTSIPLRKVIRLRSSSRARIPMSMVEEADDDNSAPDVIGSTRSPYDDWTDAVYHGLGDVDRLILMHSTGYRSAEILDPEAMSSRVGLSSDAIRERSKRIQQQLDAFRMR